MTRRLEGTERVQGRKTAATVGLCCVVAVTVVLAGCQSDAGASATGRTTPPAYSVPSPSGTGTPGTTQGGACSSTDLSARTGTSAASLGTQVTELLLRNVSTAPCIVGGLPTLIGVRGDGTQTVLPYVASADPSIVRQPPGGAGTIQPGQDAELLVFDQLNNCAPDAAKKYSTLEIRMADGAVATLPFPAVLVGHGCPAHLSQVGRANT